jgi:hypothetical protein
VILVFAVTLALGLWLHAIVGAEGFFSSLPAVVGLAAGAAVGQVIADVIARRHRGR